MKHKIIKLDIIFVVLFSFHGFSQAAEKSTHPLLDKYYPQKQNTETNKVVTTQIKPVPETKSAPAMTTTTVPTVSTVSAVKPVPSVIAKPGLKDTNTINKPTAITTQVPVQKIPTQPLPPPYRDTRLGSSTKQYDTWEKNNNGAGSVTTSNK